MKGDGFYAHMRERWEFINIKKGHMYERRGSDEVEKICYVIYW